MPNSAELTGLYAYLCVDDERKTRQLVAAIVQAFSGGRQQRSAPVAEEEEEVIDTTNPSFAQSFKGFVGTPQQQRRQSIPMNTQFIMG